MTPAERLEYLVRLAMEAYDATPSVYIRLDMDRDAFEERARERMAQAAQVWTCDVDEHATRAETAEQTARDIADMARKLARQRP